jgi:hypothetical protein
VLDSEQEMPRVFGPSQNMLTLLGYAQVPTYLGIGPKEYWEEKTALPKETEAYKKLVEQQGVIPGFKERQEWLQRAGVTHMLTFKPLDTNAWDCELVTIQPDALVNSMVGRALEPVYFYKLGNTRGRLSWQGARSSKEIKLIKYSPHEIIVETEAKASDTLVLTELDFPGWVVSVDGVQVPGIKIDSMFRGVEVSAGKHRVVWSYRPKSIIYGACVSLFSIILITGFVVVSYRKI